MDQKKNLVQWIYRIRGETMIRIAALDDSLEWLKTEEKITDRYFGDGGEEYEFCSYSNANKFLLDLDEGKFFDVYLLDVEMPEINGLQVAQEIKRVGLDCFIIYITGYVEYAVEAFEVNAYRYIPKKMLEEKLPEAYESLRAKLVQEDGPYYIIQTNSRLEKLEQKGIYYLQKEKKYVIFTTKNGISRDRTSLEEAVQALQEEMFVRIDKGCIVNLRHIMKLENRSVKMRDGAYLPVSQPQLSLVKRRIAEYWRTTC